MAMAGIVNLWHMCIYPVVYCVEGNGVWIYLCIKLADIEFVYEQFDV